ncbi:MAG: sulfurtransferase [Gammaproteobacteria bacterium]
MTYQTIISVEDLNKNINNQDWFVFDCRFMLKDPEGGLKKFNQGHIPGAQYADMDKDLASPMTATTGRHPLPNPDELIKKLQSWGVNNTSQIICYDDMSGAFAARMWWLLKWLGHEEIAVLDGGLDLWTATTLEIETEVKEKVPGKFSGRANNNMWVDVEFVKNELSENKITLLDARSEERYSAKDTKTDPVAGHVPGAMSFPFSGNLSKQGVFLSKDELRNRFATFVNNPEEKEVINMCGSGVTACHNLLAMSIADLPITKLFVGSWSEWIKDKSRPVATGEAS